MNAFVKIEDLSVIFGNDKQKENAREMLKKETDLKKIKKQTGATVANKDINLEIFRYELFVIVGLSGSGKSTLIRTLNLLNKPATGKIIVGGEDITQFNKKQLRNYRRKKVAMIFQSFGLLNHRTVLGNVEFPLEIQKVEKEIRYEKAMESIKKVGLEGWEHNMPNQLSGGMKQRVGLARALTTNPELLLMDEPYSALDPLIRREMQDELLKLDDDSKSTIIFITHDMTEAFKLGDRIALMKDSEIVQIGTPIEFFRKPKNDYVQAFIDDVDKSRVLKVRNVMRKIKHAASLNDTVEKTLNFMNDKEIDACYVTDDDGVLIGAVEREIIEKSKDKTINEIVDTNIYQTIQRNAYLKDIWNQLKQSKYDAPVIDSKGRLRGVLGYQDIVDSLSE